MGRLEGKILTIMFSFLAINKPIGMSSAQVIRDCQTHFNPSSLFAPLVQREVGKRLAEGKGKWKKRGPAKRDARVKMGHGGTLDPLATGVLVLGVGSGTKSLNSFLECTKTYETIVLFGASTDTYDRVGRILTRRSYDHITQEMVEKALGEFRGKFNQIPPLYSALKMEGKPLYEYAREGKPIPREIVGRDVEVLDMELIEWFEPGSHNHRWPTEEAETAERNLAEQVWRVEKQQATTKKLTAQEKKEEDKAIAEHESFKKEFEERQDDLIRDFPPKKQRLSREQALMSGALGKLPQSPNSSQKGANLIPPPPATNTPPPWTDKGPPAAKIRMTVTTGFYVRSFCHDLGVKVGSAAMMAELCRSRQANFSLGGSNCLEYDDLAKGETVWGPQVADMLKQWIAKERGQAYESGLRSKSEPQDESRKRKLEDATSVEERPSTRIRNSSSASPPPPIEKPTLDSSLERPTSPLAAPVALAAVSVSFQMTDADETLRTEDSEEWNGIQD
jgi:tRNA pseudouridine55 synthase